jgi:limonene-1,2-epoxide hydrolase
MIDPLDDAISRMTAAIENELVVRDFLDNFANRDVTQLAPFLSTDVTYQPSSCSRVLGRDAVLRLCGAIIDGFEVFEFLPNRVATCGSTVLVEQTLRFRLPGQPDRELISFARFDVIGAQISMWRQTPGA